MRTIVELLTIFDQEIEGYCFSTGLCALLEYLRRSGKISPGEYYLLLEYLRYNKPSPFVDLDRYWWPAGEREPRHEYLRKRIRIEKRKATLDKFFDSIMTWKKK